MADRQQALEETYTLQRMISGVWVTFYTTTDAVTFRQQALPYVGAPDVQVVISVTMRQFLNMKDLSEALLQAARPRIV